MQKTSPKNWQRIIKAQSEVHKKSIKGKMYEEADYNRFYNALLCPISFWDS